MGSNLWPSYLRERPPLLPGSAMVLRPAIILCETNPSDRNTNAPPLKPSSPQAPLQPATESTKMVAAPRKSTSQSPKKAPKKRKVRNVTPPPTGEPTQKKSPLFDKPQNYYAPPAAESMTKEQLMAWRKEQRRKRNRESAAASRNKQRGKIEELEGEVALWQGMCRDM